MDVKQRENVELVTRGQTSTQEWFRFRTGRITASKMHSVYHTNENMPSVSLIRSIFYPTKNSFQTVGIKWGCEHEDTAYLMYKDLMENLL